MIKCPGPRHLIVATMTVLACAGVKADDASRALNDYQAISFTLEHAGSRIVPVDLDGDGLTDLLTAGDRTLAVYFQRPQDAESAFDFSSPDARIELPGSATGWSIDNLAGQRQGRKRVLALVDGKAVLAWNLEGRQFSKPTTILEVDGGFLPAGAYPLNFVRDINGDGLNDLIIPGAGQLHLRLQNEEGAYKDGLAINSRVINSSRISADDNLDSRVGQRVRIPALQIRDLNGDQRPDLLSSSEERIDVFLANEQGRFPERASWSLDLKELEERVGKVDLNSIDYSNLSGLLAHTFDVQLEDVDGDGIDDLLIREGGKLTLFGGTREGINMDQPTQVLRSSGNVLGTVLRDEDGDGLNDLWLMRVQNVSLGNLFLWLAVSGSVDIETFVYKNQGQRFASRPHRKITLTVKFPSILRSVDLLTAALEPPEGSSIVRAVRAQLGDAGSNKDIAVLGRNSLSVFMDTVREEQGDNFLGLADYSPSKNNYVYDLGKILENPARGANGDLDKISGKQPDFEIPLADLIEAADPATMDVVAWDLNGDDRDDFFLLTDRSENTVSGVLLLSR